MARNVKKEIYHKLLRFLCAYPDIVRRLYKSYRFIIIRLPFLPASYKWQLIRTRELQFEIQRAELKKGRLTAVNALLSSRIFPGNPIGTTWGSLKVAGKFVLKIESSGLLIKGRVKDTSSKKIIVLADGQVLRETSVKADATFTVTINASALNFFPLKSEITVMRADGVLLCFGDAESAIVEVPTGSGKLECALREGRRLTKKGGFSTSVEVIHRNQDHLLKLYSAVRDFFDKELGTPLFLAYGTLLGYVRGGDFIVNDDDFDAGYYSSAQTIFELKRETLELMARLLRAGFTVSVNSVGRMFKVGDSSGFMLDLMPVWFKGPWLVAYGGACVSSDVGKFIPTAKGKMRGVDVYIPGDSEHFLSGYYGSTWRIPDPGYITDFRQTGKNLRKEYTKFRLSPYEYFQFSRRIESEKRNWPAMGKLTANSLLHEL